MKKKDISLGSTNVGKILIYFTFQHEELHVTVEKGLNRDSEGVWHIASNMYHFTKNGKSTCFLLNKQKERLIDYFFEKSDVRIALLCV